MSVTCPTCNQICETPHVVLASFNEKREDELTFLTAEIFPYKEIPYKEAANKFVEWMRTRMAGGQFDEIVNILKGF